MSVLTADIDGTDISRYCQTISWRPRWNILDSGLVTFPSSIFTIDPGISELHLFLDGDPDPVFSGPCWYTQPEGDADRASVQVTGWDHRVWLQKLLCKTASGDLITPGQVILDEVTAPKILAAYITNAINDTDSITFDPSGPFGPTGPSKVLPLTLGTVDTGGDDVTSVPTSFPMSIERMRALLTGTGQIDQVLTPGVGSSVLDLLDEYDNDVSGTVAFEYNTGAHNSRIATVTQDMDEFWNAIWFLMGPRVTEERWRGSVTPTAPHPGGTWSNTLLQRISDARINYGYAQKVDVFDDKADENSIRFLFEREWANEAWISAIPRTFLSIRPNPGIAPTNFRVGDQIGVAAAGLNGSHSGTEHVYGFNLDQDTERVTVSEILTSADQAGAPSS